MQRYIWNGMVLQRESDLKNRIMTWSRRVPEHAYELGEGHGIRKRIHDCLVQCCQTGRERTVCLDLAPKRDDSGEVAHRVAYRLLVAVRYRSANQDVLLASPPGERDLKRGQ